MLFRKKKADDHEEVMEPRANSPARQQPRRRPQLLTLLFAWISGASLKVLDRMVEDGYSEAYNTYSKIGCVMCFISCLAALAGACFVSTITHSMPIIVLGGTVWGCTILAVDRVLIATWVKSKSLLLSIVILSSRLTLTLVVGNLVTYVVEPALFRGSVDRELAHERIEAHRINQAELPSNRDVKEEEAKVQASLDALEDQIAKQQDKVAKASEALAEELGGGGVTHKAGRGLVSEEKRQALESEQSSLVQLKNRLEPRIHTLMTQLTNLVASERNTEQSNQIKLKEADDAEENANDLAVRIEALGRYAAKHPIVWTFKWLLTATLLLIECLPILCKFQISVSGDDYYGIADAAMGERLRDKKDQMEQQNDRRSKAAADRTKEIKKAKLQASNTPLLRRIADAETMKRADIDKQNIEYDGELQRRGMAKLTESAYHTIEPLYRERVRSDFEEALRRQREEANTNQSESTATEYHMAQPSPLHPTVTPPDNGAVAHRKRA